MINTNLYKPSNPKENWSSVVKPNRYMPASIQNKRDILKKKFNIMSNGGAI